MSDISIEVKEAIRLLTAGKYCRDNIVITPVGKASFATIIVRFSPDYTVSCTNGEDILSFISNNNIGIFSVPFVGTWNITATPENPKYPIMSESVTISEEGQLKICDLRNAIVLVSPTQGVMSGIGVSGQDIVPTFDITDYKTLIVTAQLTRQAATTYYFNMWVNGANTSPFEIKINSKNTVTYVGDISSLTGLYNIRMNSSGNLKTSLSLGAKNITCQGIPTGSSTAQLIGTITDLRFASYNINE